MIIKKHKSGNEYIKAGDVWVRNFSKPCIAPLQLTHMFDKSDYSLILKNQELNKNHPKITNEAIYFKKLVIVSDGFDFLNRHMWLGKLPKDVGVIGVNRAVSKWRLLSPNLPLDQRRSVNGFLVNNPYKECMGYLPPQNNQYYPVCLASLRTNYEFLNKYKGDVYTYAPTPEEKFGFETVDKYYIDDYRNPICAAIGFAHHFGAVKVLLLCCDDSFNDKRDSTVQLPNGLYTYPQHIKSDQIIDANLYWLTHQENRKIDVANYSSGSDCKNAEYIGSEEEAINFFRDQEEGTPYVH